MYAVNSFGKTIEVPNGRVIHFLNPEIKQEQMNVFKAILKNNFKENVDFTFAHQPFYTSEMIIFYCKTKISSSSKIVYDCLEIEKHLDEPIERLDLMRSLFQCKEDGHVCWYYLSVGSYIIERNFYDCEPINIRYVSPVSYHTFLRDFENRLITEEEMAKGELCKKYTLLGGLDMNDVSALLSHSFDRDIINRDSGKDQKMSRFAAAWKQQKIKPNGEYSNVATLCFLSADSKRKDCYTNYRAVKNMIKKTYKGSYGISYKQNKMKATLSDGRQITIYIYGTEEAPQYLFSGKMVTNIDGLKALIENKADEHESKWFTDNVKPYL